MNKIGREIANRVSKLLLKDEEFNHLERLHQAWKKLDAGFGYDIFGGEWETMALGYSAIKFFYDWYFRVDSYGHENIPREGPIVFASNHSGIVPMDAVMIMVDLIKKKDPPIMVRAVIEKLFAMFPYMKDTMSRLGQVIGVKGTFDELLKLGQPVLVFPEGARGMGKTFRQRYKLTRFNVGHVELAIENRAAIVPVAVIGGEEQAPIIYNWKWFGKNVLDVNAFPLTLTWPWFGPIGLIPLPTKYYIYYGKPLRFWEENPAALSRAEVVRQMADQVQASVQAMLDEGVKNRKSIFFRS